MAVAAFFGLGSMGLPMAINLLKAGHEVRVMVHRNTAGPEEAVRHGAVLMSSVRDMVSGADFVISVVPDDKAVLDIYEEGEFKRFVKRGCLVLEMSSCTPGAVRRVEEICRPLGVHVLDAPITGARPKAVAGTLVVLGAGDPADFEAAAPVLSAMTEKVFQLGAVGTGKIIKAMSALLGEMAEVIESVDEDLSRAYDQINDLNDELEDLEADLYEEDEDGESEDAEDEDTDGDDDAKDDDIASEPFYEVACPNCGETVYVSEDDLDAGEANCAHCGVTFEVALEGDEEEPDEDAPVQYEVTCPDCGTTAVFEEEELLEGEPKCPNCGKPLDFEVTEE